VNSMRRGTIKETNTKGAIPSAQAHQLTTDWMGGRVDREEAIRLLSQKHLTRRTVLMVR